MLLIYTLSAQPALGESGLLRRWLLAWLGAPPWLQPWLPWVDFADRHVATAAHFTLYAALAWAWLAALSTTPRPPAQVAPPRVAPAQVALAAWLLAALYGITDEWHQLHVPGRHADVHDLLTNTVGAATAALLWLHNARRRLTG
jgi:VanZ family protein